jgi:D-lyxose ketol-isomerase
MKTNPTPKSRRQITRRSMITNGLAVAAGATLTGSLSSRSAVAQGANVKTYTNSDFYDANGNFLKEKAREAYYDMFARFHYPVSDTLKKEMWILDFGLGDFAQVGMAGIFWLNRQDYGYFGHEIYLLPGQMIPEHSHLPTAKGPAKMESWQPRRGRIYTFGEGDPTLDLLDKIPASQREVVKAKHCTPLALDEVASLNRLTAWHFMVAGPEGALVTEYGTFHDMDGLRFSNPKAKL